MRKVSEVIAERLHLLVQAALAPVIAQQAALDMRCKGLETVVLDIGPLRERVAVTEQKAGLPGPAGPPGADGFSPDEITVTQDPADERRVTLAYRRGDHVKAIGVLQFSTPRYCGTHEDGRTYVPGDQVTHKGSQWHCHTITSARPGESAAGWTLQVKCGKDGRDSAARGTP